MLSFEVSRKRDHGARVLIGSRRAAARNEKLVTERGALLAQLSSLGSFLSHHIHLKPLRYFSKAAQQCANNIAIPEFPVTSIPALLNLCPGSCAVDVPLPDPFSSPYLRPSPASFFRSSQPHCLCKEPFAAVFLLRLASSTGLVAP